VGLDIYVGSLARYYLGEWETIVQQVARQQGLHVEIVRPVQPRAGIVRRAFDWLTMRRRTGREAALRDVTRWRVALGRASGLGESFDWNENLDYEYFTDKPAWDCYGALLLWACYDQLPNAKRASIAGEWSTDAAYQAIRSLSDHAYPHLIEDTEFWFPVDVPRPFDAVTILGDRVAIGSSSRLVQELELLNRRTWQATGPQIEEWRVEGADFGAPLEKSAQLGFAVFYELATLAVQHRLPMKLDY
jgi:hypothetical protein